MTIKQGQVRRNRGARAADLPPPSTPFGPDREAHLIAKALYVAQRAILADRNPAYSDAREMMELLEANYTSQLWLLRHTDNLKKAINLGFIPKTGQPICDQELNDFIKMHEAEASKFDFLEPPAFD